MGVQKTACYQFDRRTASLFLCLGKVPLRNSFAMKEQSRDKGQPEPWVGKRLVGTFRERPTSCPSCSCHLSKLASSTDACVTSGMTCSSVTVRVMLFFLLLPGFEVGGGDGPGHEGPPAVLQPWWRPGEQVGSALWPQPSRGHCVTQWTRTTNPAQRSLW